MKHLKIAQSIWKVVQEGSDIVFSVSGSLTLGPRIIDNQEYTFFSRDVSLIYRIKDWIGNILLVAINYDKKSKKHECVIEKL